MRLGSGCARIYRRHLIDNRRGERLLPERSVRARRRLRRVVAEIPPECADVALLAALAHPAWSLARLVCLHVACVLGRCGAQCDRSAADLEHQPCGGQPFAVVGVAQGVWDDADDADPHRPGGDLSGRVVDIDVTGVQVPGHLPGSAAAS